MTITRDPNTGRLSATGEIKTQKDQDLYNAINDPTIRVDINATYSETVTTSDGINRSFDAGAFMGNTVTENSETENITNNNKPFDIMSLTYSYNTVNAKQTVNPFKMAVLDVFYGKFGENMLHEFMEAYIGGQTSQKSGVSAGPAIINSPTYYIYENAHNKAPRQPGDNISTKNDYKIFNQIINSTNIYGKKYF